MSGTAPYKKSLEKELATLEHELGTLGVHTLKRAGEQSIAQPATEHEAEEGDRAMKIEEYAERTALILELQTRRREVSSALERIKHNTYGVCVICKKPHSIERSRLGADAAAKTCITHMKK